MIPHVLEPLAVVIDGLAADDLVGCAQGDLLVELDRLRSRLDAEIARRTVVFHRSRDWSVDGSRTAGSWLRARTRGAKGETNYRVHVARVIDELDLSRAAWQAGEISTKHVQTIARVRQAANADEEFAEFEPYLLEVAKTHTPEQLLETGQRWRELLDDHLGRDGAEPGADREPGRGTGRDDKDKGPRRSIRFSVTMDGVGYLDGMLDAESADLVDRALKRAYERGHRAGDPRTPTQQRADALVEICRAYLAGCLIRAARRGRPGRSPPAHRRVAE